MHRHPLTVAIALGLAAYGLYTASFVPPLLVSASAPALLVCFVAQACAAIAAAAGVWQRRGWAAGATILLGVAIATTEIYEGFVLGIIAYNQALLFAFVSIALALAVAMYVGRPRSAAG